MNKNYVSPAIIEDVQLELESRLLAQSVVTDDKEVESVGQKVEEHSTTGLEHNWQ